MVIKKKEILATTKANHRRTPGSDSIFQLEDEIIPDLNVEQSELIQEDTNDDDELIEHIALIQAEAVPQTTTPQTIIPVQPKATITTSAQLFGTSVPIPIVMPQKMTNTYVPPTSNQLTTTVEDENDISFDVPLSSTRRIKGTL